MDADFESAGSIESPLYTQSLTRRYGTLTAVDSFSFSLRSEEVLALLGPNGAGKTTLVRMLCGLLKPDSGTIGILGVKKPLIRACSLRIGYCPQEIAIWRDLTCFEQLVFIADMYEIPGKQGEQRAQTLLDVLGLSPKANELAGRLSGGMQRRLNLALAMVHDPPIFIFDEPTAGLDIQSRLLVRELIRSLAHEKGKSVIVTTHDIEEADRLANRVAIMDHGTLLKLNAPEFLKSKVGGAGMIEIVLPDIEERLMELAVKVIENLAVDVKRMGKTLLVQAEQGATLISLITQALDKQSIEPVEIRLRKSSLEDIFITLTGRSLRE